MGALVPKRHKGDYKCEASNIHGSASSQTASLAVYSGMLGVVYLKYTVGRGHKSYMQAGGGEI